MLENIASLLKRLFFGKKTAKKTPILYQLKVHLEIHFVKVQYFHGIDILGNLQFLPWSFLHFLWLQ